jgi:hypothetical protein
MDQNMDPDMTTINSPSNKTSYLIMTMNKNCEAAEHLALQTVAGLDIPFLNPLRELTKGDCWQILVGFHFKKFCNSSVLPLTSLPLSYKIQLFPSLLHCLEEVCFTHDYQLISVVSCFVLECSMNRKGC